MKAIKKRLNLAILNKFRCSHSVWRQVLIPLLQSDESGVIGVGERPFQRRYLLLFRLQHVGGLGDLLPLHNSVRAFLGNQRSVHTANPFGRLLYLSMSFIVQFLREVVLLHARDWLHSMPDHNLRVKLSVGWVSESVKQTARLRHWRALGVLLYPLS